MKKWFKGIFFLIFAQFALAQTSMPLGEQLERNLFKAVQQQDWATLDSMIAPGFQTVHADKIRNRSEGIDYIKSLRFKDYSFHNVVVTNPTSDVIVVSYEMTYRETVGQKPQAGKLTKNISVWKQIDGKWMWVAHAVFD